jgi:protein-disulfide isomerase
MNQKRNLWSKITILSFLAVIFCFEIFAQTSAEDQVVLATGNNGKSYTVADLSAEAVEIWKKAGTRIAEIRETALAAEVSKILFAEEAALRRTTVAKLLDLEVRRKIVNPPEAQIKQVFEANRAEIGNRTLEEVRPNIVSYLKYRQELDLTEKFAQKLNAKFKTVRGVDVNSPNLKPTDVLAIVNGKTIVAKDLEERVKAPVFELREQVYEIARLALDDTIYADLVLTEAKKQGIGSDILIRREIFDKTEIGDNEAQERLKAEFQAKLFRDYKIEYRILPPQSPVFAVSTLNQPSRGNPNAPVTVIMFSDFQCGACAKTHPIVQAVLAEFGEKVRFVVRDFPLKSVHKDAFQAALAANAAAAQGKFFEYTEILYKNQTALDAFSLRKYAEEIGLNLVKFDLDIKSAKIAAEVEKDLKDGENLGISSTPTIYINGRKVRELSEENFRNQINKALAEKAAVN